MSAIEFPCLPVLAFIGGIGMTELLIIGFIVLLLFGSRLPSVMGSLGKSIVEFKKGMNDTGSEEKKNLDAK